MIRAEQRLEHIERSLKAQHAENQALKAEIEALKADKPEKRGPGRPPKVE
jgi:cell division protein FtsB